MKNVSSRNHHYIPQFYSRGFRREDETFDVYDKQYSKFKNAPQTPALVFFERDRNTIKFKGKRTDQIEKLYSKLENDIARVFALIRDGISAGALNSPDGIFLLKIHVAMQFWRLPQNDALAMETMKRLDVGSLASVMTLNKVTDISALQIQRLLESDSGFRHYFRSFWLPFLTFDLSRSSAAGTRWYVLDVEDPASWSNHICSDSPLVFSSIKKLFKFSGPFAMPLSRSKLLVATVERPDRIDLEPAFSTRLAMLSYLQAARFVATPNREFLEGVIDLCRHYSGSEGEALLRNETLGYLE